MKKGPRDRQEDENLDDFAEEEEYWKILKKRFDDSKKNIEKRVENRKQNSFDRTGHAEVTHPVALSIYIL